MCLFVKKSPVSLRIKKRRGLRVQNKVKEQNYMIDYEGYTTTYLQQSPLYERKKDQRVLGIHIMMETRKHLREIIHLLQGKLRCKRL